MEIFHFAILVAILQNKRKLIFLGFQGRMLTQAKIMGFAGLYEWR